MSILVLRKSQRPVRWCQTAITATLEEPPRIAEPRLPKGALIDELGQSTTREWPGKTRSVDEMKTRLKAQLAARAFTASGPPGSRHGADSRRGARQAPARVAVLPDASRRHALVAARSRWPSVLVGRPRLGARGHVREL